jgi:hypothetical protein
LSHSQQLARAGAGPRNNRAGARGAP